MHAQINLRVTLKSLSTSKLTTEHHTSCHSERKIIIISAREEKKRIVTPTCIAETNRPLPQDLLAPQEEQIVDIAHPKGT